jgi:UDP-glucose 4-epimerase
MNLSEQTILVTGGAGFIGSHLVDQLIAENPKKIVIVDNFFLGQESNLAASKGLHLDVELLRLDASDLAAVQDVVRRFDVTAVYDLAVVPLPTSLEFPEWTIKTNVGIATTFCEIIRSGLIEKLIHISSSEAYGSARYVPMDEDHPHDAITPYAASKSAADHIINSYVQTFAINATIVRPFNNFGPRQNPGSYAGIIPIVIRNVLGNAPITIFGDGNQTRDFIFVRETAKGIIDISKNDACVGKVLNFATGVETTINDLVAYILNIMGVPDHPVIYSDSRPGDVLRHCADITMVRELLGYAPNGISEESLRETVEWYSEKL